MLHSLIDDKEHVLPCPGCPDDMTDSHRHETGRYLHGYKCSPICDHGNAALLDACTMHVHLSLVSLQEACTQAG